MDRVRSVSSTCCKALLRAFALTGPSPLRSVRSDSLARLSLFVLLPMTVGGVLLLGGEIKMGVVASSASSWSVVSIATAWSTSEAAIAVICSNEAIGGGPGYELLPSRALLMKYCVAKASIGPSGARETRRRSQAGGCDGCYARLRPLSGLRASEAAGSTSARPVLPFRSLLASPKLQKRRNAGGEAARATGTGWC